eukprot:gene46588-41012_t
MVDDRSGLKWLLPAASPSPDITGNFRDYPGGAYNNGTVCCGYVSVHDVTEQAFLWTNQYLVGWNAAVHTQSGECPSHQPQREQGAWRFALVDIALRPTPLLDRPSRGTNPTWVTADYQGGILRALQLKMWDVFPASPPGVPSWDTVDTPAFSWAGRCTAAACWAEFYRQSSAGERASFRGSFEYPAGVRREVFATKADVTPSATDAGVGQHVARNRAAAAGLQWVVVSTVREDEYLSEIRAAVAAARAEAGRQHAEMRAELGDAAEMTAAIAAAVSAAVIAATWAAVWAMTAPLG